MRLKSMLLAFAAGWTLATPVLAQEAATAPAPAPVSAQANPAPAAPRIEADPALWVVRDEDTTIYLFGTFHLLDANRDWFNDEVRTAFDASQQLVLEILMPENPAEMQPVLMRFAVDPQGRTTSSRLTPEQWAQVRRTMGEPFADTLDRAHLEPWFFSMTLGTIAAQRMGVSPEYGPETILRREAGTRNMRVDALETLEFQFGIFDGMSEESQVRGLTEAVANFDDLARTLQPMLQNWSNGNVEGLAAILNRETMRDPAAYAALFTNRNRNWSRWIQNRLREPGTVFIAVGAGHLGGPGSVQAHLAALGIRAQRVPHTPRAR